MDQTQQAPPSILCDNMSALALVANPRFHARTKHIEIQHHYIRDVVARGVVKVGYINTDENIADVLTKGLVKHKHYQHLSGLDLDNYSSYLDSGV